MLRAVYSYKAANPNVPVIVIMLAGRPMSIAASAGGGHTGTHLENWDAFIVGWLPGSETGDAMADILFGDKDFFGKSPYAWRTSFVVNSGVLNAGTYPASSAIIYPIGHGLTRAGTN
jgi:beta-glucosidase